MSQEATILLAALAAIAATLLVRNQQDQGAQEGFAMADDGYLPDTADTMADQLPDTWETITVQAASVGDSIASATGFGTVVDPTTANINRRAFLDMIAYSEGTAGPNGYRTMFGGTLARSLADHPRQVFTFTNKINQTLKTTAAGRYQFLMRTWDALAKQLDLPDFGPASQDAAALELVRQRGALKDVDAGRVSAAIAKCAPIWASLPGAGYNQPERKLTALLSTFSQAGGNLEA